MNAHESGPTSLDTTVDDYLAHLSVERGLSDNTLAAYRRDLTRYAVFLAAAGRDDMAAVSAADVTNFATAIREGADGGRPLAASSAARTVTAVRGLHRFAHAEGLTSADTSTDVTPVVPTRSLPKALSVADVGKLLDAARLGEGPVPLRDTALLEFLYGTGARISEIITMSADDVDFEHRSARVTGKGRKQRIVPVGSHAVAAIEAYLVRGRPALAAKGQGTPVLFLNTLGRPLSRQSAWAVVRRCGDLAGLDTQHLSPHILRHSFATHLIEGGADVRVVQELLGHSSVTTTQIYTDVTIQHLREIYVSSHPRSRLQ